MSFLNIPRLAGAGGWKNAPPAPPAAYPVAGPATTATPARVHTYKAGTADAGGNLTLTFDAPPEGTMWTGSLQQPVQFPGVGTWQADLNGFSLGVWAQGGQLRDVQVTAGDTLTVTGANLSANTATQVVFYGRADLVGAYPLLSPWVLGPAGIQEVASSPIFPIVTQDGGVPGVKVASASAGSGATIHLVAAAVGVTLRVWNIILNGVLSCDAASASGAARVATVQDTNAVILARAVAVSTTGVGTVQVVNVPVDMRGTTLTAGAGLDLTTDAAVASTHFNGAATVTYTTA